MQTEPRNPAALDAGSPHPRATHPDPKPEGHRCRNRACGFLCGLLVFFAATMPVIAKSFPPRVNGAWVYDPRTGEGTQATVERGHFAQALAEYNSKAPMDARIREYYIYGGDLEMYCPDHDAKRCSPDDMHVYYSQAAQHGEPEQKNGVANASVRAYARNLSGDTAPGSSETLLVPIIDGVVSGKGALHGFNELSRDQASAFADKVARQVCAGDDVAGIQFDIEPFDVGSRNGQYYFYRRVARDFASRATGCVDERHPQGRFFSIFTTANRIRSNSASARNVQKIMDQNNGYLIDALYDLLGTPPGQQTPLGKYRAVVGREARNMRTWAAEIGVKYQFGVPAAAGAHEFARCEGMSCRGMQGAAYREPHDKRPSITQLDYVKAAFDAIRDSGAVNDPRYLGVAVWAWGQGVPYRHGRLLPAVPPPAVLHFLAQNLTSMR